MYIETLRSISYNSYYINSSNSLSINSNNSYYINSKNSNSNSGYSAEGGAVDGGVQWIGVVSCSKLVYNVI